MKYLSAILILAFGLQVVNAGVPKDTVDLKARALEILRTKCNVCHAKKNPRKFFTTYNMNGLAPKINTQVFVKKRMPKGKDIKLTPEEFDALRAWLNTQNLNKNIDGN